MQNAASSTLSIADFILIPVQFQERPSRPDWRQRLIESRATQNVLRVLVVLGVGAIMGDGVLTPVTGIAGSITKVSRLSASIAFGASVTWSARPPG